MSTRSWIGIENEDRSVNMIYCHNDGYPSYNGRILNEHYQDAEKVRQLMALGPISVLAERLAPSEGEEHSWETQIQDVVVSYARDRKSDKKGGKNTQHAFEMLRFDSTEVMLEEARKDFQIEYVYMHTENGWVMWDQRQNMEMRLSVRDVLANHVKDKE